MNYLKRYLDHIDNKHYAKKTKEKYHYILTKAESLFTNLGLPGDEKNITEHDMFRLYQFIKDNVKSDLIKNNLIMYLKVYFRYLEKNKIIFESPLKEILTPKEPRNHRKVLTRQEISAVFDKINGDSDNDIRVRTMLEVLYSTAIRPGELLNLKISDIDFEKELLFIDQGKGKKDRYVPIGESALYCLKKYLQNVRPNYSTGKSSLIVFVSFQGTGNKLYRELLYQIIQKALKDHDIPPFCPYTIRATAATHLLENGMPCNFIKEILGHDDIRTTMIYLKVNTVSLKDILDKKHPRLHMEVPLHDV